MGEICISFVHGAAVSLWRRPRQTKQQTNNQPSRRNILCCAARRRRRICVQETATIKPTIGKRALISGTGTTPILAVETTETSVEPLGTAANWTLGADIDCSSKPVLAMASSSSVAGRVVAQAAQEAKAPAQQRIRSVLVRKQLGLKVVIGNIFASFVRPTLFDPLLF